MGKSNKNNKEQKSTGFEQEIQQSVEKNQNLLQSIETTGESKCADPQENIKASIELALTGVVNAFWYTSDDDRRKSVYNSLGFEQSFNLIQDKLDRYDKMQSNQAKEKLLIGVKNELKKVYTTLSCLKHNLYTDNTCRKRMAKLLSHKTYQAKLRSVMQTAEGFVRKLSVKISEIAPSSVNTKKYNLQNFLSKELLDRFATMTASTRSLTSSCPERKRQLQFLKDVADEKGSNQNQMIGALLLVKAEIEKTAPNAGKSFRLFFGLIETTGSNLLKIINIKLASVGYNPENNSNYHTALQDSPAYKQYQPKIGKEVWAKIDPSTDTESDSDSDNAFHT